MATTPVLNEVMTKCDDPRFIDSNTKPIALEDIRNKHIIPVFVKDNTPTISQADFVSTTIEVLESKYPETSNLALRVSHPIKGRIFSARNKKASELEEHEKTLYYERMAFSFDIPTVINSLNDKEVSLSVVGVKAYNQDNLYGYGNSLQRFKVGIGQKVKVCTNLCLFTNGTSLDIKVRSLEELTQKINELLVQADIEEQAKILEQFNEYQLTQEQFATLLGRSRMYNHLPKSQKKSIPELLISDSQVSVVTKSYYQDENFPKNDDGSISLWNLYNLFTDAVKSSYIDSFMDRNLNAFTFTHGLMKTLDGEGTYDWFLN